MAGAAPAVWLLAGCTSDGREGDDAAPRPDALPSIDPDAGARSRAIEATTTLIGAYEAVLARPGLDAATITMLAPLLSQHLTHLAVLRPPGTSPPPTTTSQSGPPRTSAPTGTDITPATTTPVPSPPPDLATAVGELRTAEQASSAARADDAVTAVNGAFARLIASIAACGSVHVAVLDAGAGAAGAP